MVFLNEVGALAKIQQLMETAQLAKIAVAFWGRGAAKTLGIDRRNLAVEIICNLDSGACNPAEIERIRDLRPHIPVLSDPRLHGKLYWTPGGVIVGSSNASTNGLAVEDGLAGWAEANIFSDDKQLIESTLHWFKSRKQCSYEITDDDLRVAREIWAERARSAAPGIKLTKDLGTAVRKTPDNPAWTKIKVAIYSEDISKEGKKLIQADRASDPSLNAFDAYESWDAEMAADDWLLDFWLKKKTRFGGYWYVPNPKLRNKLVTYVRKAPCVKLQGFGKLQLSASDLINLETAALAMPEQKMRVTCLAL
jgi:hypothetical protein